MSKGESEGGNEDRKTKVREGFQAEEHTEGHTEHSTGMDRWNA